MRIRVILKSGAEFTVKCEGYKILTDKKGNKIACELIEITENSILHVNGSEIAAVIRVLSDEVEVNDEQEDDSSD